ncbi:MAG: lamin tail domain-containing protein [Planctomycetota bacterium]
MMCNTASAAKKLRGPSASLSILAASVLLLPAGITSAENTASNSPPAASPNNTAELRSELRALVPQLASGVLVGDDTAPLSAKVDRLLAECSLHPGVFEDEPSAVTSLLSWEAARRIVVDDSFGELATTMSGMCREPESRSKAAYAVWDRLRRGEEPERATRWRSHALSTADPSWGPNAGGLQLGDARDRRDRGEASEAAHSFLRALSWQDYDDLKRDRTEQQLAFGTHEVALFELIQLAEENQDPSLAYLAAEYAQEFGVPSFADYMTWRASRSAQLHGCDRELLDQERYRSCLRATSILLSENPIGPELVNDLEDSIDSIAHESASPDILISEVSGFTIGQAATEFIEIINASDLDVSLEGYTITIHDRDIDCCYRVISLPIDVILSPGQAYVVTDHEWIHTDHIAHPTSMCDGNTSYSIITIPGSIFNRQTVFVSLRDGDGIAVDGVVLDGQFATAQAGRSGPEWVSRCGVAEAPRSRVKMWSAGTGVRAEADGEQITLHVPFGAEQPLIAPSTPASIEPERRGTSSEQWFESDPDLIAAGETYQLLKFGNAGGAVVTPLPAGAVDAWEHAYDSIRRRAACVGCDHVESVVISSGLADADAPSSRIDLRTFVPAETITKSDVMGYELHAVYGIGNPCVGFGRGDPFGQLSSFQRGCFSGIAWYLKVSDAGAKLALVEARGAGPISPQVLVLGQPASAAVIHQIIDIEGLEDTWIDLSLSVNNTTGELESDAWINDQSHKLETVLRELDSVYPSSFIGKAEIGSLSDGRPQGVFVAPASSCCHCLILDRDGDRIITMQDITTLAAEEDSKDDTLIDGASRDQLLVLILQRLGEECD